MGKEIKFMFDRRFDLPSGSLSSNVSEVLTSVIDEMVKPENNLESSQIGNDETTGIAQEELPPEPTFTVEETEALKKESFNIGLAKGLEQAKQEKEELIFQTAENIASAIMEIQNRQSEFEQKQEADFINLALTVCEKILPEIIKKQGVEEVKALLEKSLPAVSEEKKLIIKVSPDNQKTISQYLTKSELLKDKENSYTVTGDETLQNADCIISWKNGSVERKTAETFHTIKDMVNNYTKDASLADDEPENEPLEPEITPEETVIDEGDENDGQQKSES